MISYPAKYTVVLKSLLDNEQTKTLIDSALSKYKLYEPISKNEYIPRIVPTREELNNAILNHYKYREIGFESVGRFIDELEISMNEIMPYYNQLFFTQDQDFNIIYNVDYKRTIDTHRTGESTNTATGTASSEMTGNTSDTGKITGSTDSDTTATDESTLTKTNTNTHKKVESLTPQSELDITAEEINSIPYADKVEWDKDNTNGSDTTKGNSSGSTNTTTEQDTTNSSESNSTATSETLNNATGTTEGTENTLETTKGNFGVVSAQDLVLKYRETILNTVQMIINDKRIAELFMLVY